MTRLGQVLRLPRTLAAIRTMQAEDLNVRALDEHLAAFARGDVRRWTQARLGGIGAEDVAGMATAEMASMMHVAMEIEEPILEYSRQNARGFGGFLPALARYMGDPSAPWCREELRHANTFARLVERLTGEAPARGNPNRPMERGSGRPSALRLLTSRQAAEWSSSSTYTVMAAHCSGGLGELVRNIARDEIKHLAILSAVDLFVHGWRPWGRLVEMARKGLEEYGGHRRSRSEGGRMGTNWVTAFEVVVTHLLAEWRVRRWMGGLGREEVGRVVGGGQVPDAAD